MLSDTAYDQIKNDGRHRDRLCQRVKVRIDFQFDEVLTFAGLPHL